MLQAKVIIWVIVAVALVGFGFYEYRTVYNSGKQAGMEQIQDLWDKDKIAVQVVTDKAIADATAQRDMALKANEVIHDDYETKLSAAAASANLFAQRLRDAYRAADRGAVPKGGSGQGSTAPSQPSGNDRLTGLLSAAAAECLTNDDTLDALVGQISPQL
jgi:hypothetical protein